MLSVGLMGATGCSARWPKQNGHLLRLVAIGCYWLQGLALVIDGHSLGFALEDELRGDLLEISLVCRAGKVEEIWDFDTRHRSWLVLTALIPSFTEIHGKETILGYKWPLICSDLLPSIAATKGGGR